MEERKKMKFNDLFKNNKSDYELDDEKKIYYFDKDELNAENYMKIYKLSHE